MKKKFLPVILAVAAMIIFTPRAWAQSDLQKDSLRNVISLSEGKAKVAAYNRLCFLYMSEVADDRKMDTLLMLFDEMDAEFRRQGNIYQQGLVRGNRLIAFSNRRMNDEIILMAPECLDFLTENDLWPIYYQVSRLVIDAHRNLGQYEQAVVEAEKLYEKAKQQDNAGGMGIALYSIASTYNRQFRWEDAEKYFRECIDVLKEEPSYLNIVTQAYPYLCTVLRMQGRYEDALELLPEFKEDILRFEEASGSRQGSAWGNYYTAGMYIHVDMGNFDEAEYYCDELEKVIDTYVSRYEIQRSRALIALSRGQYPRALEWIDLALENVGTEDIYMLNPMRHIKMSILMRMGRTDEALALLDQYIETQEAIHDGEVNARFDEIRTQYEVEKHIAEKERNRNYFLFALGGCVLLLLLLGVAFRYNRVVTRKNRNLYLQIKEQDRLEEELDRLRGNHEKLQRGEKDESAAKAAEHPAGDRQQSELVARLREYLHTDNNLTGADVGRDEVISELGTNRNTLSEAVRAVTGKTLMEYIRHMQLDEARRIIDRHPELTVEAIAADCGFNTPSTFYRLFRKHYGISPAEYRKMARSLEE